MSKRKPNFSDSEVDALVHAVERNLQGILGRFSGPGSGNAQKTEAWRFVERDFCMQTAIPRNVDELRKKWTDLKLISKREVANFKRRSQGTGGGPPPPPPPEIYQKIVEMLGIALSLNA